MRPCPSSSASSTPHASTPTPLNSVRAAARRSASSDSANSASRFHRTPSGRCTGRFGKRWTTSSDTRSPSSRPMTTRPLSAPRSIAANAFSGKVEHLLEPLETSVRPLPARQLEERRHLRLPPGVHVPGVHRGEGCLEVIAFQVPHQQPVVPEEQRVVAPARLAKRLQHLRPHLAVPRAVLIQAARAYAEQEADTFHVRLSFSDQSKVTSCKLAEAARAHALAASPPHRLSRSMSVRYPSATFVS